MATSELEQQSNTPTTIELKIGNQAKNNDEDVNIILKDFPKMRKRNEIILEVVLVSLFSLLSFGLAMSFLYGNIAAGMDGGYYELQVKALLEEGKLYYESPFLSFFIMAFFALISGNNITFGVYFSASLFLAAAVVSCYFSAKIIWNRKVAMLTLPFSALSVLLLRTSSDLIKNLLALVFIPLAVAYFNKFHLKKTWKSFALSLLFSALTIASHLMATLVLSISLVCYFVMYTIITLIEERKFDWKKHLLSIGILVASAVVMGLMWVINEFAIPVKETFWEYSSNAIPDGDSSYLPSEDGIIMPIGHFFGEFSIFEIIITVLWFILSIVLLAITKSTKEKAGVITLCSLFFPVLLLGISIDVTGWLHRMQLDAAPYIILCGAYTCYFAVMGLEWLINQLDKKMTKVQLAKIKPKITVTLLITFLLIAPMISRYLMVGNSMNPYLTPEEENDLTNIKGKLPVDDCVIYAVHGLEYWTAYFSEYQTMKTTVQPQVLFEIYQLLNDSSAAAAYYINYRYNPFIPMVQYNGSSYSGETFTLNNPVNASIQSSYVTVDCFTESSSNVVEINYRLLQFPDSTVLHQEKLDNFTLIGGETIWNYSIPVSLNTGSYILDLNVVSSTPPSPPTFERTLIIFHKDQPIFNTVYLGSIYGIIENNPDFNYPLMSSNSQINGEGPPPPPPGLHQPRFSILTFPLKLQIPVLTGYFHYYLVIPITIAYWTLLMSGCYLVTRKAINLVKNKRNEDKPLQQIKREEQE